MRLIACCLCFLLVSLLHAAQVDVTTLDMQQIQVEQAVFADDHVQLGDQRLPYAEILQINQYEKTVSWTDYHQGILLQDGSWLPTASLEAASEQDVLKAVTPFGDLKIPLEIIAAWGDYERLAVSSEYDRLLLKNNNQPFGELFGFEAGQLLLQTDLSDEPLVVPLGQIEAVRLRQQPQSVIGLHGLVQTHPQRPPLKVLFGTTPRLAIKESIALDEWLSCQHIQVIGPRLQLLGDMSPSAVVEKGMFGKVWPYAVNSNIDGSPILLNGTRYQHGVVMHSYALLSWPLPADADRFRAVIGISDLLGREGNCIVRIRADEKLLWSKNGLRGGHKAHAVDLDVRDFKTLHIEVDYGERFDIGDHVVFANAYVLKAK